MRGLSVFPDGFRVCGTRAGGRRAGSRGRVSKMAARVLVVQVGGRGLGLGEMGGKRPSGAKAHRLLSATYGTTEVVP